MVDVITACKNLKPSQVPLAHRTCAEAAAAVHAVGQQLRGQEPASQLQPMPRLSSTPTQAPAQPGPAHATCPHHLPDQPPLHPSQSQLQGSSQHHPALPALMHLPGLSILTRPATNPVTSPAVEQQPIIHTTEEQDEQTMPPSMPKQQQDWATASVEIMSEHWHAQQIGILVACAYFKNKEGVYKEHTVYVMTDGKEQSAAITQAAVNQVVCYLLAEHDMDMRQLYMWSDGCAGQFKGAPAMRQHWGMAQRFSMPVWWSYGATAHFKGRHDSEGGVVKQWLRGEILADRVGKCNALGFVQHCNAYHKPAAAADPSKAHRARASVGHRWCLELSTREVELCSAPQRDAHAFASSIPGSMSMHSCFFPAAGIQVEWSETACACAQCMTPAPRGVCMRPSITKPFVAMPMFDQKRDDKHWDDECLTLLCSFAPDSVKQLCTLGKKLSVKMLNEYCKAVGLYVPANTLRADLRPAVIDFGVTRLFAALGSSDTTTRWEAAQEVVSHAERMQQQQEDQQQQQEVEGQQQKRTGQRLPMCDPRVWDAHGTWEKHKKQICAMADMQALSVQDQQQLQSHLEVYYLACPVSNAPVESLLQLLKHGTGMFMELPALLELMSMRIHIDAIDGVDVLDFAQRLPELRKEVRREEAAAARERRTAKAEMKAAAATHRVGQVVVDVGDHEGQHRLEAAYALTYDGRDYSHTTLEEAEKLSVRELQAYLRFHQQELMKGWLKPKLKGLVMAHICNTVAALHGDELGVAAGAGAGAAPDLPPPPGAPPWQELAAGAGAAPDLPPPPAAPPWQELAAGAGAAPGLPPSRAAPPWQQQAAGAGAAPGLPTPPAEQQGVRAELDTSSTRKRRAGGRDRTQQVEQGNVAMAYTPCVALQSGQVVGTTHEAVKQCSSVVYFRAWVEGRRYIGFACHVHCFDCGDCP
ncbi:hypothetical protein QJQ45_013154 [Haematococcus lacustris]|nr:hypothetical protein QJQ45_013154 [Haematococcus lacustris]